MNFMTRFRARDRYLTRIEVGQRVSLSTTQIIRLEKAGLFPAPMKLGPKRVGWLASSITSWMQVRTDARQDAQCRDVSDEDIFISETEVLRYSSLSRTTLNRYLQSRTFPRPVRIGDGRKAWLECEVEEWCQVRKMHDT